MKKAMVLFGVVFMMLLCSFQVEEPVKVNMWHLLWSIVVPVLAGLYEVICRVIPTVKNYSFLQKIIEILLWLSNFLNARKKK